jgi:hypothetical protein
MYPVYLKNVKKRKEKYDVGTYLVLLLHRILLM